MPYFTDSHCHLDFPELAPSLDALLTKCWQEDIRRIIIPAVSPTNWSTAIHLVNKYSSGSPINTTPSLFLALGIHPWFLTQLSHNDLNNLNTLLKTQAKHIVAIGETGIDGKIAEQEDNLVKQITFFEYQLTLAQQYNKPAIIHHRKSHHYIVPILKKFNHLKPGIVHAFSGSYQQAKHYLDLGYKLGIGGTITYPRAAKTINTIKKLPLSSLVLETDAPSMPLSGYQGQPNTPLMLKQVFNVLCQLRPESPEVIAEQIEKTINDVFTIV